MFIFFAAEWKTVSYQYYISWLNFFLEAGEIDPSRMLVEEERARLRKQYLFFGTRC